MLVIVILLLILAVLIFGAASVKNTFVSCLSMVVAVILMVSIFTWAKNADLFNWLKLAGIIFSVIAALVIFVALQTTNSIEESKAEPIDEFAEAWKAFGQIAHRVDDEFMQQAWAAYDAKDLEGLELTYQKACAQLKGRQ